MQQAAHHDAAWKVLEPTPGSRPPINRRWLIITINSLNVTIKSGLRTRTAVTLTPKSAALCGTGSLPLRTRVSSTSPAGLVVYWTWRHTAWTQVMQWCALLARNIHPNRFTAARRVNWENLTFSLMPFSVYTCSCTCLAPKLKGFSDAAAKDYDPVGFSFLTCLWPSEENGPSSGQLDGTLEPLSRMVR